jgi:hypothetical protein
VFAWNISYGPTLHRVQKGPLKARVFDFKKYLFGKPIVNWATLIGLRKIGDYLECIALWFCEIIEMSSIEMPFLKKSSGSCRAYISKKNESKK